jgi:DNA-binding NtrC family response regulator
MKRGPPTVLVVDVQRGSADRVALLKRAGFHVTWARDEGAALQALAERRIDCVVTRHRGRRIDGLRVLDLARASDPHRCVVVLADALDADAAAEVMERGADDLQVGPVREGRLLAVLRRGLAHRALAARMADLEGALHRRDRMDPLTGASPGVRRVVDQIRHVAPTRAMVLIEGEAGTGKAHVARAIHQASPRADGPFVRVSLGSLKEAQAEIEIFGDGEAGEGIVGSFERADQGTLFLEAIHQAPPALQERLLSVIQGRGSSAPTAARRGDVRILASTDQELGAGAVAGRFRADLLERLGAVRIVIPPLRERRQDIPLLVERFVRDFNRVHGRRVSGVTRGVLERLEAHSWPGNVEELRTRIEAMVVAAHGRRRLDLGDLPGALRGEAEAQEPFSLAPGMTVEEAERHLIELTLRHVGGNKPRAAAMLGIGLRTLYRKMPAERRR